MADLYDLGERPPLGMVPKQMHAYAVRQNRFGQPKEAWKREVLPTPSIGRDEVLVYVMASGINFNNVWAALGTPVDVIGERQKMGEPEDFHAGGSDCSGIVWAIGADVKNVAVGDEVIVHSGWWRPDDPWVLAGKDPMLAESTRIWGYQTNYGSYCRARAGAPVHPEAEAADVGGGGVLPPLRVHGVPHADGLAAPRRRARRRRPRLGGGGRPREHGAGHHARARRAGGGRGLRRGQAQVLPRARRRRRHYGEWAKGARAFGKAIWDALGEKTSPRIVFEHPGEATLPTSGFVCATGGMIVICAGTTGYNVTLDLRYHWMRQKRLQGSHLSNDEQAAAVTKLVAEGRVDPCLSRTYGFDDIPECHQLMLENKHPYGNMAVLVNATRTGLGAA
jgi:crotonyl-CoA carboxylase/reductase